MARLDYLNPEHFLTVIEKFLPRSPSPGFFFTAGAIGIQF
jgi:hypothetical protein